MILCLYALTGRRPTLPPLRGLAGEPLRLVTAGTISAVVGGMRRVPVPASEMLTQYDGVIRGLVSQLPAVLPARFGSCFDSPDELRFILQSRQRTLQRAVAHVRNRAQMTVRIVGAGRAREADTASRTRGAGTAGGVGSARGRTYLRERASAAVREREIAGFEPVRDAVRRWIRDERVDMRRGIASVYHLVPRSASETYRKAIVRAASAAGLQVVVSGPWPPYAFADL
jgi:hypothetical protein